MEKIIEKYAKGSLTVSQNKDCTNILNNKDSLVSLYSKKRFKLINNKVVYSDNIEIDNLQNALPTIEGKCIKDALMLNIDKVKNCVAFTGKDDLRPILKCVHINKNDIVSTDAHILVKYSNCVGFEDVDSLNIPKKALDFIEYSQKFIVTDDAFINIINDDLILKYVKIDGRYPNYNAVIPETQTLTDSYLIDKKVLSEKSKFLTKVCPVLEISSNLDCEHYAHEDCLVSFKIEKSKQVLNKDLTILLMKMKDKNDQFNGFDGLLLNKIATQFKTDLILNFGTRSALLIGLKEEINQNKKQIKKETKPTIKKETNQNSNNMDVIEQMAKQIAELTQKLAELTEKKEVQQAPEIVKPKISIEQYSEKSYIIYGETKAFKDELIKIGARFNPFLKLNDVKTPGWIVSNAKIETVKTLIYG